MISTRILQTTLSSKVFCMTALLVLSITLSAQTVLLSDGFENGKGSWVNSTGHGGHDFKIVAGTGYQSNNSMQSGAVSATVTSWLRTPKVTIAASQPYRLSFMAKAQRNTSRSIEIYFSTNATLDASATLMGSTELIQTTYSKYTYNFSNPPAGEYYIYFKLILRDGNVYNGLNIDDVLFIQTTNYLPTAEITLPANNSQHTAGKPLNVSVTAADSDGTVASVQLFYRGLLFGTKSTAPYDFVIPNLPLGNSTLFARAFDNAGDSITSATSTVTGVNTPPSCALNLSATAINQGEIVTLTASPSDSDGEIESVSFYVNNEKVATLTDAPYRFDWSDARPGIYNIFATATDNTGLIGFSDTLVVNSAATTTGYLFFEYFEDGLTNWKLSVSAGGHDWRNGPGMGVDGSNAARRSNTIPNFMVYNEPLFFVGNSVYTVDFMARVDKPDIYALQAGLINGTDTTWSTVSATILPKVSVLDKYSVTITTLQPGYYNFIVRAVRVSATNQYQGVVIDDITIKGAGGEPNLPPVVRMTSPLNKAELAINQPVQLSATAYDLVGTIDRVDFYQGNVKLGTVTSPPYTMSWTPSYPGAFSLKAVGIDSEGAQMVSAVSTFVNYPDRKFYDFVVSSYLGEEAGSGKVWGSKILSDGVIVLACEWGSTIPEGAMLHVLNGATSASRGAVVRISADGRKILSVTKLGNYAVDLSVDDQDNIFVAAADNGLVKLNRLADKVLFAKTFPKNVYRVDAGKSGYSAVLTRTGFDFDGKKWDGVSVYLQDPSGNLVASYGGASTYTNDVCIDEASQSVVVVGWRNTFTNARDNTNWLPVDIPGLRIFSFQGILKYEGYNWSHDPASPRWLNRAENNMADTRISRVSMGADGLLYFLAEVSGGNHPLRYSPYDTMKKVRFVGGDHFHVLSNVGTEFHTFVGRMNIENGQYIEGQSFTARLSTGKGNTLEAEHGNVQADEDGRVYFTGTSAYGLPMTRDSLPEVAYTGGSFIYIMNPTLQIRELVDRVVRGRNAYDVGVRRFANQDRTIVYAGSVGYETEANKYTLFLKNPIQSVLFGQNLAENAGFFAVIGGTRPAQYELRVNGVVKGLFTEGTKIALDAADYIQANQFRHWGNGGAYLTDSLSATTTFSMPGTSVNLTTELSLTTDDEWMPAADIRLYPNPSKGMVNFRSRSDQPVKMELTDTAGRRVYVASFTGSAIIDLSHLPAGMYFVSFDNQSTQKLILQETGR